MEAVEGRNSLSNLDANPCPITKADYPNGLPDADEDKIGQIVDAYQAQFIQNRDIDGIMAHEALDMIAESRTRMFYKKWSIFGGNAITPQDVPFDVEGDAVADQSNWEYNKGSYMGLDEFGQPKQALVNDEAALSIGVGARGRSFEGLATADGASTPRTPNAKDYSHTGA